MHKHLKIFTAAVITLLIAAVVIVSCIVRFGVDLAFGVVRGTIGAVTHVITDGSGLAGGISFENGRLHIGGNELDFGEIGRIVSDSLDAVGVEVTGGGVMPEVKNESFTEKRYAFDPSISRSLDIDVDGCDVTIAGGNTDRIIVVVLENEQHAYRFAENDNTLYIRDSSEAKSDSFTLFGISFGSSGSSVSYTGLNMLVLLPADFSGDISVDTENASVRIGGLALDDELDISAENGSVEVSGVSAHEIDTLSDNGSTVLTDLSASVINAEASNGRISMSGLIAKKFDISTRNASIDFVRLLGEKFTLSTTNGDIEGSIIGSESLFTILTETDRTASPASRENQRAQYSLHASTTGGDIAIRFVE